MNKYTVRMERTETVPDCTKRKKVLWEYVLEPLDKVTYWDHAPLPTEERRTQSKRALTIANRDELRRARIKVVGDLCRNQSIVRAPRLAVWSTRPEPIFFWKFGKDVINYYLSLE